LASAIDPRAAPAREGRISDDASPGGPAARLRRRRAAAARWRKRQISRRLAKLRDTAKRAARRARDGWIGLKGWQRHWIVNIGIGLTIELVLHATASVPIVTAAQNLTMDAAMQAQSAFPSALRPSTPITFIDVDAATWRDPSWGGGRPYVAPREKLAALIDYAFRHDARIVVLDVAVDEPPTPGDAELVRFLDTLAKPGDLKPEQQLLVIRTIDSAAELAQPTASPSDLQISDELRPSPLEAALVRDAAHVHETAPYFETSRDGVLRDWRLWRSACQRDTPAGAGHWRVIPSVQLAVAAMLRDPAWSAPWPPQTNAGACLVDFGALGQVGTLTTQDEIDRRARDAVAPHRQITHHAKIEGSADDGVDPSSRIFYRWRWGASASPIPTISATEALSGVGPAGHAWFHEGVVVIGQSFADARDMHATPLGAMPGSLVLANAIGSILDYGVIQPPNQQIRLLITAGLIVAVGLVFALLDSFQATLATLAIFLPLVVITEYGLLTAGYWLDFAVPLLGIYLHRLFAALHEYAVLRRPGEHSHGH